MKFRWKYCKGCHTSYIECPKCGNNCCNSGFGRMTKYGHPVPFGIKNSFILGNKVEELIDCDVCPKAYEVQQQGWDNHTDPWYYRFRSWCHNIYINLRYGLYQHRQ